MSRYIVPVKIRLWGVSSYSIRIPAEIIKSDSFPFRDFLPMNKNAPKHDELVMFVEGESLIIRKRRIPNGGKENGLKTRSA